jgi:TolA-binding protein
MPTKDPITAIGVLATVMLVAGATMLYLTPPDMPPAQNTVLTSPFKGSPPEVEPPPKEPAPVAPTLSTPLPSLTAAELAQLTPAERTRYEKLLKSLQQVSQQVQVLEQENANLQQAIQQNDQKNQALDAEINKLRPQPPADAAPSAAPASPAGVGGSGNVPDAGSGTKSPAPAAAPRS